MNGTLLVSIVWLQKCAALDYFEDIFDFWLCPRTLPSRVELLHDYTFKDGQVSCFPRDGPKNAKTCPYRK